MNSLFACRFPEELRIAQSVALVRQLPLAILGNGLGVLLFGAVVFQAGAGWAITPGIAAIGVLLAPMLWSWLKLRRCAAPQKVSVRRIVHINIHSGLLGLAWAVLATAYVPPLPPEFRIVLAAGVMVHGVYAITGFYFLPVACLAYALPAFFATLWSVWKLAGSESWMPVLLLGVLALACAALWFLKVNWSRFHDLVGLSAEQSERERIAPRPVGYSGVADAGAKDRFLKAARHDLRQPMHAMELFLGTLSQVKLPSAAHAAVINAQECAGQMNDMLRSLIDLAGLDMQAADPQWEEMPISAILESVRSAYAVLACEKDLLFTVRDSAAVVRTDPGMAERIVLNLVSNAVRHTPSGRVLVACRKRGRFLRVEVRDTGPGIDDRHLDAIFEEFFRVPRAGGGHTCGLGLGLPVARRMASALKAPLAVRSWPGRGSLFSVEFPLVGEEPR